MGNAPASTIVNTPPVGACNTSQTTTWSGNWKTGQIERHSEYKKEDCSKPDYVCILVPKWALGYCVGLSLFVA
ncbi:unnamed protein product [Rotaria sp. Silwood1]|nr:unnamed protein product [Rotaria sp. Silwood1]